MLLLFPGATTTHLASPQPTSPSPRLTSPHLISRHRTASHLPAHLKRVGQSDRIIGLQLVIGQRHDAQVAQERVAAVRFQQGGLTGATEAAAVETAAGVGATEAAAAVGGTQAAAVATTTKAASVSTTAPKQSK